MKNRIWLYVFLLVFAYSCDFDDRFDSDCMRTKEVQLYIKDCLEVHENYRYCMINVGRAVCHDMTEKESLRDRIRQLCDEMEELGESCVKD